MKSPAFRFYPADFMGSPDVQAMDLHEVWRIYVPALHGLAVGASWISGRR